MTILIFHYTTADNYQGITFWILYTGLFLPFYTCRQLRPSSFRPDAFVLNEISIILFVTMEFIILNSLTVRTKGAKIKMGPNISLYIVFFYCSYFQCWICTWKVKIIFFNKFCQPKLSNSNAKGKNFDNNVDI